MNAIVLRAPDKMAEGQAKKHGLQVVVSDGWELPAPRTLFVAKGVSIPWTLLPAGFSFLEKWDIAAPLWRYGVLADDIGGVQERERTRTVTLDLRMLLYAHELLFVRASRDGQRFLNAWLGECGGGAEPRLAFLRALHMVKPLFCSLPRSWLRGDILTLAPEPRARRSPARHTGGLVKVQVSPGLYIQCKPGDEVKVLEHYRLERMSRKERREAGR